MKTGFSIIDEVQNLDIESILNKTPHHLPIIQLPKILSGRRSTLFSTDRGLDQDSITEPKLFDNYLSVHAHQIEIKK
jgi:hypothetical protein